MSNNQIVHERDGKAQIVFTPTAWVKMILLIENFDMEVAWHGVAFRNESSEANEYIVKDIVVYPQEVTGSTVEMDTETYAKWLIDNIDDERFNHIRMQGHSHVKMDVSPSLVDLDHQKEILSMLRKDDFYIFMIWNKSFSRFCTIYDMKTGNVFTNKDVDVKCAGDDGLNNFLDDAIKMVRPKVKTFDSQHESKVYLDFDDEDLTPYMCDDYDLEVSYGSI